MAVSVTPRDGSLLNVLGILGVKTVPPVVDSQTKLPRSRLRFKQVAIKPKTKIIKRTSYASPWK